MSMDRWLTLNCSFSKGVMGGIIIYGCYLAVCVMEVFSIKKYAVFSDDNTKL